MFKKSNSSPGITVEFRYNIVNFDKKRSVPKEIPSEVEVSVVKMIVITRDNCMYIKIFPDDVELACVQICEY